MLDDYCYRSFFWIKWGKREIHGAGPSFHVFVTKKNKYPFELGTDVDHIGSLLSFSVDSSNPKVALKGSTNNSILCLTQRCFPLLISRHIFKSLYTFLDCSFLMYPKCEIRLFHIHYDLECSHDYVLVSYMIPEHFAFFILLILSLDLNYIFHILYGEHWLLSF